MMYTYLENIDEVRTRHNFPYNLIGKIRDIELCRDGRIPFYCFALYNDNCDSEYTCIVKESMFEKAHLKESDSVVIEYVKLDKFMEMGECLLIRRISKPVLGFTGNRNEDILILFDIVKGMIESEFQNGNMVQSYHSQVNRQYLAFRKSYLNSRKKGGKIWKMNKSTEHYAKHGMNIAKH